MAVTWTTQRSGNWSLISSNASSPWYDGGTQAGYARTPGSSSNSNNDLVIIANGHTLTCDASVTCGDATTPASNAISNAASGTGILSVSTGVTLTVVSNVLHRGTATWTFAAGSNLAFNSGTALVWTMSESTKESKLVFNGTSGSHCTVTSTGAANGRFTYAGGSIATASNIDATYTDFSDLGDSSNSALLLYGGSSTVHLHRFANCTFDACGNVTINNCSATGTMSFDGCTWTNGTATRSLVPIATQARTSGVRLINNCSFDKIFGLSSSLLGWTITGTAILGDWSILASASLPWDQFSNNFIAHPTSTGGKTIPGVLDWDNPWNYFHFHANGSTFSYHGLTPSSYLTGTVRFGGFIMEPGDTTTDGDYMFVPSPASASSYYYKYILFLPNKNGLKAGDFASFVSPQTNATAYFEHGTFPSDGVGETGIHWGETYKARTGMIGSIQSNLCWGYNAANANIIQTIVTSTDTSRVTTTGSDSTVTGTSTKWLTGTNGGGNQTKVDVGDYIRVGSQTTLYQVTNVASDTSLTVTGTPAAASSVVWAVLPKDVATTVDYNGKLEPYNGTDGYGYNSGLSIFTLFTTPPGSHDVTLSADPFVDSTRNIATWIVYKGQASSGDTYNQKVTAAYTYIGGSPSARITDLVDWVKAGWKVTDSSLNNAGHDGVTIGALDYESTGSLAPLIIMTSGRAA